MNYKKNSEPKKEESMSLVYTIFGVILFPLTIPLILNVFVYRINVRSFLFNKWNLKYKEFDEEKDASSLPTLTNLISVFFYLIIFLLSVLFLSGVFDIQYMSKLAYAFAFLFAIAGIILSLIGIIWFFILKTLFSKRKQKLIDQEIYKQKMLENEKIVKEFFKKENGFYVWVFCLDLKDKHLKLLEKFDLNKKKRNTKAVFLNDSCYIPEKSLSKHISIIGSTGVGKTTTAKKFIKAAFENDWNFIFLDGKADIQFEKELNELAKKSNKKLNCWSKTANNEFKYNPFKGKTMEENISLIMEGFDYTHIIISDNHGVAYYKMMEKSILDSIYPYMT